MKKKSKQTTLEGSQWAVQMILWQCFLNPTNRLNIKQFLDLEIVFKEKDNRDFGEVKQQQVSSKGHIYYSSSLSTERADNRALYLES